MSLGSARSARARSGALGRRNPTVKLGLLLAFSCALLAITDPVTPTALYVVATFAVLVSGSLRPGELVRAQLPFLAFAVSIVVVNVATRPGGDQLAIGPMNVGRDGLALGVSFAARALVIGVLTIAFVRSTDPARLMVSLHQHARLPEQLTYAVLAATRLLDQLPEMLRTTRLAHAVRDPGRVALPSPGRLPLLRVGASPRAMGAAAFTVLVVSLRRGERMSMALQARALGAGARTILRPVSLTRADAWLVLGVVVVTAGVVVWSSAAGFLEGPAALVRGSGGG